MEDLIIYVFSIFDQAFYANAAEVLWKNKGLFSDTVTVLGGFHLLMMFLGILGTRYGDAGLREIAVQSDIMVDRALEGKIRIHKIVYESLNRLLYASFVTWIKTLLQYPK